MVISFKTETIVRVRPGALVERGDTLPDWSTAVETDLPGWRAQPLAGDEVRFSGGSGGGGTARDAVVQRWKLFGPDGDVEIDLTPLDRVRVHGELYEIDGPIQRWSSPTGLLEHVEVTVEWVAG